jgi:hypothetical protein
MTIEEVNRAHFRRLRAIDRLYDTGRIDYEELQQRERDEERRYDRELKEATE